MQVSKKIYSGDYQLTVCSEGMPGMILSVIYPDGQRREIGYDLTGTPNRLVDIDSVVWTREDGSRLWQAPGRDSWNGEIEVVPATSKDALPGTICIRRYDGNFIESESLLFPIGISLDCHYTRDKTEVERHVHLLDGRKFQFKRQSRNALWFGNSGQVSHQPDNPLVFASPWNHPSLLHCLV